MSTYDPTPGQPYGTCVTCALVLEAESDAKDHMRETICSGRSHSIAVANRSREQRIQARMRHIIDAATERAMEEVDRLVDNGDITETEVGEALSWWPDFSEARADWVEEAS